MCSSCASLTHTTLSATIWDRRSRHWKGRGMRTSGERMRQRILDAIEELTTRNSRPPTNRELGQYLGGKCTGHIDYHLRILKDQGKINHDPKKSRGISVVGTLDRDPIPTFGRQV